MAAHPAQLLIQLLLGLAVFGVLVLALHLFHRANRRRRIVSPDSRRTGRDIATAIADRSAVSVPLPSRRRTLVNGIAACMLLGVFAGKYLVAVFYPSGGEPLDPSPSKLTTVTGASGAALRVARYGAPEGSGPVLLFTHGWGADRRDWLYAIRSLPPGRSIVTWDLPGLGESTPTAQGDYALPTLARDLDRVVASLGDRPVVLVGHSIGGMLNLEYARQFPDKLGREVRALVLANTTYTNPVLTKQDAERSVTLQEPIYEPLLEVVSDASPVARVLGWFAYQSGLAHLQLATQSFAGAESWEQLDDMARYAYRSSPRVVARGVRAMLEWDATDVLRTIAVPTLVISGDEDVTTLPAASDRIARDIRSAERVRVRQAAHLGPVEQHRVYADAIEAFASKVSEGGPDQLAGVATSPSRSARADAR